MPMYQLVILKENSDGKTGTIVESYTTPDGSWIQTKSMGAQPVLAVLKDTYTYRNSGFIAQIHPLDTPDIRPALLKMVNSRDKQWGRNGIEYIGAYREKQGGTALNRLRELAHRTLNYGDKGPVPFLPGEAEMLIDL